MDLCWCRERCVLVKMCRDDGLVDLVRLKNDWSWRFRGIELEVRSKRLEWDVGNIYF